MDRPEKKKKGSKVDAERVGIFPHNGEMEWWWRLVAQPPHAYVRGTKWEPSWEAVST
jgi:hypothetical protein